MDMKFGVLMGVVVVGDTAAICGGIWLVIFVVAIFGGGI